MCMRFRSSFGSAHACMPLKHNCVGGMGSVRHRSVTCMVGRVSHTAVHVHQKVGLNGEVGTATTNIASAGLR